jgi:ParB family chromosome partitioning protein
LEFDLVCGQGRLEAYRTLGWESIPAIVVSAKEEDCLVMSLVENIARRQHPAIELMREIESLHKRGFNETEIGLKLGVTNSWVGMLLGLLEHGEERLVAAVETGLIPIYLAVTIARSDDAGIHRALAGRPPAGVPGRISGNCGHSLVGSEGRKITRRSGASRRCRVARPDRSELRPPWWGADARWP